MFLITNIYGIHHFMTRPRLARINKLATRFLSYCTAFSLLFAQGGGYAGDANGGNTGKETAMEHARKHASASYVCPMHPQVVSSAAGQCPICGMDLVLKEGEPSPAPDTENNATAITVSPAVVNQLGVRTATVRRGTLTRRVNGFGVFLRTSVQGYRPVYHGNAPSVDDTGTTTSAMLVQAQVFERDAPLIKIGQHAKVRFPGVVDKTWNGTVIGLEAQVNQVTHTQLFHIAVDPKAASIPPGMSATLTVEIEPIANALLVPREALIVTGNSTRVIVAEGNGRFSPREVKAQDFGEDEIVIHSGLNKGEQVVVSAQFLLDSEANLQAGLQRLNSDYSPNLSPKEGGK